MLHVGRVRAFLEAISFNPSWGLSSQATSPSQHPETKIHTVVAVVVIFALDVVVVLVDDVVVAVAAVV